MAYLQHPHSLSPQQHHQQYWLPHSGLPLHTYRYMYTQVKDYVCLVLSLSLSLSLISWDYNGDVPLLQYAKYVYVTVPYYMYEVLMGIKFGYWAQNCHCKFIEGFKIDTALAQSCKSAIAHCTNLNHSTKFNSLSFAIIYYRSST